MTNDWNEDWPGADWPDAGSGDDRYRRPRRAQNGPPPWLQEIFGFASPPRQAPRRPRVRRGDVRTAIIDVLHRAVSEDRAINGYQVIQEISDLSGQEWRPSPGSVYPTIQQLQDEGLVEEDEARGRRTIRLTEQGVAWARDNSELLDGVWEPFRSASGRQRPDQGPRTAESGQRADLKSEIGQVVSAVWQLVTQGSVQQRAAAIDVLVDTRRRLYTILADGRDAH